jgi:HD superfamily phosphohydrolase
MQDNKKTNKLKIFNDPIYGFIHINDERIFDVIEHPFFQRLRRISQLGLTYLVYPGAIHNRFQHSMGAMHLMKSALQTLSEKGIEISKEESFSAQLAILLHDIGHGPFSHTLENSILENTKHEDVGLLLTNIINKNLNGKLDMAISIMKDEYHRGFFHQLLSSQLDVDRLDYLKRDSYYTGVNEGIIGTDRLIKMINVHNDKIAIEFKGIYSVEKFLVARRIMYWQVYLHKTALGAERILIEIINRARYLVINGTTLQGSETLISFLKDDISLEKLRDTENIEKFAKLDDHDIFFSIKMWASSADITLKTLSSNLLLRNLPRVIIQKSKFKTSDILNLRKRVSKYYGISLEESKYFVCQGKTINRAYNQKSDKIFILSKDKQLIDIATASDNFNIRSLSKPVSKYYVSFPKEVIA